jgi:hypothetical protein
MRGRALNPDGRLSGAAKRSPESRGSDDGDLPPKPEFNRCAYSPASHLWIPGSAAPPRKDDGWGVFRKIRLR